MEYDVIIIGGGPAGMAAAYSAWQNGLKKILIIERDKELGGILNQCIHNGFGLHYFKEELTGPEYAERFIDMISSTQKEQFDFVLSESEDAIRTPQADCRTKFEATQNQIAIEVLLNTMVLEITCNDKTALPLSEGSVSETYLGNKKIHAVGKDAGYVVLDAKSIILAMGCRERTRGAISIPGSRPAGIFTAGAAQRYCNMEGYMVGKRVVILGSGDIGLIMARRMVLEGAEVLACVELMPYSGGLSRNIVQCLNDFDIPLYLSHTITEIRGAKRVEHVVVSKVDENRRPVAGTEFIIDCDTVLLSVGLIPENELSRNLGIELDSRTGGAMVNEKMETSIPGIFACGNVLHVHDLVDYVSTEAELAGTSAAEFVLGGDAQVNVVKIINGNGVSYTVPQRACTLGESKIYFRVNKVFRDSKVVVRCNDVEIASFKRAYMAPGEMQSVSVKLQAGVCVVAVE